MIEQEPGVKVQWKVFGSIYNLYLSAKMKLISGFRRNDNYKTNVSTTKPSRRRKTTPMRKHSSNSHQFPGISQLTIGQPISERFDRKGYNLIEHNVVGLPTLSSFHGRVSHNDHRHSQATLAKETAIFHEMNILDSGKHKCRVNIEYVCVSHNISILKRYFNLLPIFNIFAFWYENQHNIFLSKKAPLLAITRCKMAELTYFFFFWSAHWKWDAALKSP